MLSKFKNLINSVEAQVHETDQQFSVMLNTIEEKYKELHKFLAEREKQHLSELLYYK